MTTTTRTRKPTDTLRRLHAALVAPYEWDAGTVETVAEILAEAGYIMPGTPLTDTTVEDGEEYAEELEWVDVDDPRLDAFRPAVEVEEVEA
jgi:hypothetical protein